MTVSDYTAIIHLEINKEVGQMSGIYSVDELAMARSKDELQSSIKETILNGDTVSDDDCKVNFKTLINNIDEDLVCELLSRIDRTNPSYSKVMGIIDEVADKVASDLTDKFNLVF